MFCRTLRIPIHFALLETLNTATYGHLDQAIFARLLKNLGYPYVQFENMKLIQHPIYYGETSVGQNFYPNTPKIDVTGFRDRESCKKLGINSR